MEKIIVTIDFEYDWGGRVKTTHAVEKQLHNLLDFFDKTEAQATFFISTETIKQTHQSLLEISKHGHEIASHGHHHYFHYDKLQKNEIEFEIETSKKILEDLTGKPVLGFRTPYFKKNLYTDECLLKAGYIYDSSAVETTLTGRYVPYQHNTVKKIKKFNVSTINKKHPAGLKWMNILGGNITSRGTIKVIYLHMFDLLSLKDVLLRLNRSVSPYYALFYMARVGSIFNTLRCLPYQHISIQQHLGIKT